MIPDTRGPGGKSYVKRQPVDGGFAYLTRWETAHSGTSRISTDLAGYADWIDTLFKDGALPEPELWALEALADRLRSQATVAADKAAVVPSMKVRVAQLVTDLKAVESKIAEIVGRAEPVAGEEFSLS